MNERLIKANVARDAIVVGDEVKVFLHGNPLARVDAVCKRLTVRFADGTTMTIPRGAVLAINGKSVWY